MADDFTHIRWRSQPGDGLEHCAIREAGGSITLEGMAILGSGAALRYRIVLEAEWAGVKSLHLTPLGGATLALRHDGLGVWTDGEGRERKELEGLTDAVILGSPVLAMGILRRLQLRGGKTMRLDVIACDAVTLGCTRSSLEIATLEAGSRYRLRTGDGEPLEVEAGPDGLMSRVGDIFARIDIQR